MAAMVMVLPLLRNVDAVAIKPNLQTGPMLVTTVMVMVMVMVVAVMCAIAMITVTRGCRTAESCRGQNRRKRQCSAGKNTHCSSNHCASGTGVH